MRLSAVRTSSDLDDGGPVSTHERATNISVRTVESYRAEIMEKMRAESVIVLVRQAIRLGRIAP
jgi:Bacterial regulatory proteins, luxR family